MSEAITSTNTSFTQRLAQYTPPIIAVLLGLFAFHWGAMHAEEQRVKDRSDVRVQTLADTAVLALREPLLSKNVPAVMILVEGLVRENHDVLTARVGGKDGKAIAEMEAEHVDPSAVRSVHALRQPISVRDASGAQQAIGVLDLEVSTEKIEQVASANTMLLIIEGGMCLLLCGGLVVLSRKHSVELAISSGKRIGAGRSTTKPAGETKSEPANKNGKHEMGLEEPRAPRPSSASSSDDEAVEVTLTAPSSSSSPSSMSSSSSPSSNSSSSSPTSPRS